MRVREVIVVEGRYDKAAVKAAVEAKVIETSGFSIFSDTEKLALIHKLAEKCGVIILTDSDHAGFLIRGHLKGMLVSATVKHAYIPQIPGRERRKKKSSAEGLLGVEGMPHDAILKALRTAGATFEDEQADTDRPQTPITNVDLYELGLSGGLGSSKKRGDLLRGLNLPVMLKANALLDVLNTLYTREEFLESAERIL